jgi:hypothetical protein
MKAIPMERRTFLATVSIALMVMVSLAQAAEHGKGHGELGRVALENSCEPAAQASLQRGVALLHSFWFDAGEASFREALERDSQCALAAWGIGSVRIGNTFAPVPTQEDADVALKAIELGRAAGTGTERERLYVDAISRYFEQFHQRTP